MTARPQPEIAIGEDLTLRPWRTGDATAAVRAFNDPDIQRWHVRRLDTEDEAVEWIAGLTRGWAEGTCATWAIVGRPEPSVLGRVSIYTRPKEGHGEIAYWVMPDSRGRGIATRVCVAATIWAHELGFHRIHLEHSTQNEDSRRVALKVGFVEEGVHRESVLHADGWHDMCVYLHLATDPI